MRTSFQVRLDDSREHLAVVRSVFALVIDRGSKRPECELSTTETKATSPPPPSFSGGGKWEAMHDDMAGYFEVRVQGGGMNHRLFCVLERTLRISGARASSASTDCRRLRARRLTRGTTGGSCATAPSSRSGGGCSCNGSPHAAGWQDLQLQSSGERHQGRERGVRPLRREETADRLRLHPSTSSQLGLR